MKSVHYEVGMEAEPVLHLTWNPTGNLGQIPSSLLFDPWPHSFPTGTPF